MNDFWTFFGYFLAAIAVAGLLRLWWSTRNVERIRLQKECERAEALLKQQAKELEAMRDNKRILDAALLTHQQTIRQKQGIIDDKENDIKSLKAALKASRKANETLNDIVGNQELVIEQLQKDVDMLKDQVLALRIQLGLEPRQEDAQDPSA